MDAKYIKRVSTQQEKRVASLLGGRVQPGSGNKDGAKGDSITGRASVGFNTDDFLCENKFTFDHAYTLTMATWKKIAKEALRENMRTPMMQIDVGKNSPAEVHLVVFSLSDFWGMGLQEHWKSLHWVRETQANSAKLDAFAIFDRLRTTSMYREQITFQKSGITLVVLHLEDYKNFIAKY